MTDFFEGFLTICLLFGIFSQPLRYHPENSIIKLLLKDLWTIWPAVLVCIIWDVWYFSQTREIQICLRMRFISSLAFKRRLIFSDSKFKYYPRQFYLNKALKALNDTGRDIYVTQSAADESCVARKRIVQLIYV